MLVVMVIVIMIETMASVYGGCGGSGWEADVVRGCGKGWEGVGSGGRK